MNNPRELRQNEIMISRIGKETETENYLILSNQRMIDGTQTYKVQWWSQQMKYFWSDYDLSFNEALDIFMKKVKGNQRHIKRFMKDIENVPEQEKSNLPIKWESMISKQYFKEKLHHFLGLMKDDMLSKEDLQEIIDELTPICLEHIFRGSIFCINCKEEKESKEEEREVEPIDITDSPIYDEDNDLDEKYENKTYSDI